VLPLSEHGQPAGIKIVERASQFLACLKLHPPTVPQIRRCFERSIVSHVVIFRDLDCVFGISKNFQVIVSGISAMAQNKTFTRISDQDLTETKGRIQHRVEVVSMSFSNGEAPPCRRAALMQAMRDQSASAFQKFAIFMVEGVQLVAVGI